MFTKLMTGLNPTHMVVAADLWSGVTKFTKSTSTNLTKISWGIFLVAAIVAGIMFAFGRDGSQMAKGLLGKIVIGVLIVALATAIISTIASMGGASPTF